jgi:hypothetical protein
MQTRKAPPVRCAGGHPLRWRAGQATRLLLDERCRWHARPSYLVHEWTIQLNAIVHCLPKLEE